MFIIIINYIFICHYLLLFLPFIIIFDIPRQTCVYKLQAPASRVFHPFIHYYTKFFFIFFSCLCVVFNMLMLMWGALIWMYGGGGLDVRRQMSDSRSIYTCMHVGDYRNRETKRILESAYIPPFTITYIHTSSFHLHNKEVDRKGQGRGVGGKVK